MQIVKLSFVSILFLFFSTMLIAEKSAADIKAELILEMQKDGYLNEESAKTARQKYISEEDKQLKVEANERVTSLRWTEYLSWINFFKVVGVIFFLVAFSGMISKIISGIWFLVRKVPVIVYQLLFLSGTLLGTIRPNLIWDSQSFYIALFSSFANILLLSWIVTSHEKLQKLIQKIFNFGIPIECVASFFGIFYFVALAYGYQSQLFGFFAAVCLSGVFSFTVFYTPGTLFLYFKEDMLKSVVFGHLVVLFIYVLVFKQTPESTKYFDTGVQYYCTIALGVGLLVGASPFYKLEIVFTYIGLFILLFFLASFGYFFYDLKVIASIIFVFFILFALEWVGFIGFQTGLIFGSLIIGGSLYATALLLEKYGSMLVW